MPAPTVFATPDPKVLVPGPGSVFETFCIQLEAGVAPGVEYNWTLSTNLDDDPSMSIAWDRAWNDPQNDSFVRRRLKAFQNPAIGKLTGDDGYPGDSLRGAGERGRAFASKTNKDPPTPAPEVIAIVA